MLTFILQRLNVQHGNLDPSLCQKPHNRSTDAIAPTRDDNHFLTPVIFSTQVPIVQDPTVQKFSDALKQAQDEGQAKSFEQRRMRDCSLATLPCISREQEPWEDQVGVENGSAEEPPKCVCGYTWKGSGSENGDEVSESTCCLLLY